MRSAGLYLPHMIPLSMNLVLAILLSGLLVKAKSNTVIGLKQNHEREMTANKNTEI